MEEDLIECPMCEQTDYVHERETSIMVWAKTNEFNDPEYVTYKFFCSYCNKDF